MGRTRLRSWLAILAFVASVLLAIACEPAPSEVPTEARLLSEDLMTYGALPVDMDGDGHQDVLLNNHGYPDSGSGLYLNDGSGALTETGGVFDPVPNPGDLYVDRHDCDVADVDRNGRLDIYCTAGAHLGNGSKPFPYETNELFMQQPNGTFVNKSDVYGVTEPYSRGRDVAFVNANGDAYPDLITTADRRTDGKRSETILYLNQGGTRFLDKGQRRTHEVRPGPLPGEDRLEQGRLHRRGHLPLRRRGPPLRVHPGRRLHGRDRGAGCRSDEHQDVGGGLRRLER